MLIGHVIAAYHVVSDVYHKPFINIEIHLPLVCHSTRLLTSFGSSVMSSVFLALWQSLVSKFGYLADNISCCFLFFKGGFYQHLNEILKAHGQLIKLVRHPRWNFFASS